MIEAEFDEVSHPGGFKMVLKSMGWKIPPKKKLTCAQQHFSQEQAFTSEDVNDLSDVLSDNDGDIESNDVQDFTANLVAEYMSDSLKKCSRVKKHKRKSKGKRR